MNLKLFKKNLRNFYKIWNKYKQDTYGGADVLVVSTSTISSSHTVSDRFCVWLLGYLFADTTAIFTLKEIHFICPKHKASVLKALTSSADEAVNVQLIVHEKAKGDDGGKLMDEIFYNIRLQLRLKYFASTKNKYEVEVSKNKYEVDGKNKMDCMIVVGHVEKESLVGYTKILKPWDYRHTELGFDIVDIKDGLSKFAKVDAGEKKDIVKEYIREPDSCGIKQCDDERVVDIYLQELPKEAEEKILLAEVSEENPTLRRRGKKVEAYDSEIDEWILV